VDTGNGPFAGLKVIDCASYIAAPVAATLLADFGADVVKIEPLSGDPHRSLVDLLGLEHKPGNFVWELASRHKRSLALDLKHPDSQAVLQRLVAQADVFITNLPLPVRERLGIDATRLRGLNPRLVYASMTAYGEAGPEAAKSGFDVTAYWARSGLMDLVRNDEVVPPAKSVAGMGDHPSATTLFAGIAMALYRRERTGQGALVSTSLLANGVWSNAIQVQAQLSGARFHPRQGRHQAPNPLSNTYRCRDGRWLSLVVLNEARQLPVLLVTLGLAALQDDPRLADGEACRAHAEAVVALFDEAIAQQDLATWRQRLDAAGITFGVVGTLADVHDDEQMRASGALVDDADGDTDGGTGRPALRVANPLHLDGVAPRPPRPAPALGQHSLQVLREAGLTDEQIGLLVANGVVRSPTDGS
jgi:crotonobetainyl-CoA:carnitine CoA-transferase CaiB-like acyl-CoA transferase